MKLRDLLKEYTDRNFSGKETIPQYLPVEGYDAFREFFPKGSRSEKEAHNALKNYDRSQGQKTPMFVHVQYHEFEDPAGEKYSVHQTQYYNSNYKDARNPGVTKLVLIKKADKNNPSPQGKKDQTLGRMVVMTSEYVKDLKRLNITKRSS